LLVKRRLLQGAESDKLNSLHHPRLKIINNEPILKSSDTMKNNKETWKAILQIIASIIASVITAMGTTSCMGYGPF